MNTSTYAIVTLASTFASWESDYDFNQISLVVLNFQIVSLFLWNGWCSGDIMSVSVSTGGDSRGNQVDNLSLVQIVYFG